MKKRCT